MTPGSLPPWPTRPVAHGPVMLREFSARDVPMAQDLSTGHVSTTSTAFPARAHFGLLRPRFPVLGCDFAGQVEAAGPAVSRFGLGEAMFGTIAPRFGAHAE